jgi:pimeloyl-ACP methyl ester carboxylesterase
MTSPPPAQSRNVSFTTTTPLKRWLSGLLLAWPWFDRAGLQLLKRAFFPASRAWAAAEVAGSDIERFYAAVPMPRRFEDDARLVRALHHHGVARAAHEAIEAAWEAAFFGGKASTPKERQALEAARLGHAHAYNLTRRHFGFLLPRGCPRIAFETLTPAATAAIYGAAPKDAAPFFAPPERMPNVEVSEPIPGAVGEDTWLRFASPSARLGDFAYARVHTPLGAIDPPTIVLGHGVCVEFDNWIGLVDEADALTAAGFRVIRPEAPFHGRRRPPGSYGGERLIGTFPTGALDAFTGALREWAVIADWARATSKGRLAFGGTSLGALTAQLAADRAGDWPERLRPEGLFLITHNGSMHETILHGELTNLFAGTEAAQALGWTEELIDGYFGLLDPKRPPVVPPERIVSILGKRDTVTPFASGEPLVASWKLPPENVFVLDRGHFSVPMTLIRNGAPVQRFVEAMRG